MLKIKDMNLNNVIRQGDTQPREYQLDTGNLDLNLTNKSATIRLMTADFQGIGYETTATVSSDNKISFSIDDVIPAREYRLEVTVDDYVFPSRATDGQFNIDPSSHGQEASIIQIIGKDEIVREVKEQIEPFLGEIEQAELDRQAQEVARETAEGERETAEEQRKADHADRSADNIVLNNLVDSGDGTKGLSGWNSNNSSNVLEDDYLTNIGDGTLQFPQVWRSIKYNAGEKYYVSLRYRTTAPLIVVSTRTFSTDRVGESPAESSETWYTYSDCFTPYDVSTLHIYHSYNDADSANGGELSINDVILVNITEAFGAGNEPTKEKMDELIKVVGYIDGEYVLNNKEMLGYLMNSIGEFPIVKSKSEEAITKANQADNLSKSVQSQFNQVVIDGDSSVEAAQARVDASGHTNATLKERLDKEHNEITTQLAQTAISVKSFGAKGDGITDDTESIKQAVLFFAENEEYNNLIFPKGEYVISGPIAKYRDDVSITNKTIDGRHSTIIDKRIISDRMFVFVNSDNVVFKNFYVVGGYDHTKIPTDFDAGAFLVFDKTNNNIRVSDIRFKDYMSAGIEISPRRDMPITNVEIENITGDVVLNATLLLGSLDQSFRPSEIRNITVNNVTTRYNGTYRNVDGEITRTSGSHWTPGIDYGEALDLLENAILNNCHVSYASESGFHVENRCACVNVQLHNCSSKFNGARDGAVYGYGFMTVKGVQVNNSITEGNRKPYVFHSGNPIYESSDNYMIDIYDKDYGKIFDEGQKILTFNEENNYKLEFIHQDSDKKAVNIYEASSTELPEGHTRFYELSTDEHKYKYHLPIYNASDLIKFDKKYMYKYKVKYKKTSVSEPLAYLNLREESNYVKRVSFPLSNDTSVSSLGGYFTMGSTFKIGNADLSNLLYANFHNDSETYYASIERLTTEVGVNLIENPMLLDEEMFDFAYNTGGGRSSKFINVPDPTKAYVLMEDEFGRWISTNNEYTGAFSEINKIYTMDYPLAINQKVSVLITHKANDTLESTKDYLRITLSVYDKNNTFITSKYKNIMTILTTQKTEEIILDPGELPSVDGCYFRLTFTAMTNKNYNELTPIKFRVLDVHRMY